MNCQKKDGKNKKDKYQKPVLKKVFIEPLMEKKGEFKDNIVVGSYSGACASSE